MLACSIGYCLALLYVTLLSEVRYTTNDLYTKPNFKILGLKRYYIINFWHLEFDKLIFFLVELIGNIVLLVPFPFMLYYFWHRKLSTGMLLLMIFLTTLSIETLQYIFKIGVFDIDDLILNFAGGLIGTLLFNFIYRKFLKQ